MTAAQEPKFPDKTKKKAPIMSWKEYFAAFPNPLPKGKKGRGRTSKKNLDKQEVPIVQYNWNDYFIANVSILKIRKCSCLEM
jgi:hypothetical protein